MTGMDTFPEDDKRWFMHIGYLAQNWAAVETTLDGIVRQIFTQYGGVPDHAKPPQAYNKKRNYVHSAFNSKPQLAGFAEGLRGLLDKADHLAEIRNWAMHSGWAESDAASALLRRYNRSEPLRMEHRTFSLDEIYSAAVECASLTLSLTLFGQRAFGLMTQEQLDDLVREIAGQAGPLLPLDDPAD